jgi:hypothetical protein
MLTSLPLQVFLYFGGWWDALFWVVSIAVFVYKGVRARLSVAQPDAVRSSIAAAHPCCGHGCVTRRASSACAQPLAPHTGMNLPYPRGRFEAEFTFQFLWLLVEPPRLFLGAQKGKVQATPETKPRSENMRSCSLASGPSRIAAQPQYPPHAPHPGSKGNKTEQPGPLVCSLLLSVPMVAFLMYYLRFQTFV